jgi:hypothetical protein
LIFVLILTLGAPLTTVWTKNTIFAVYSKKFRKIPISLKSRIRTQYLMGKQRRTLQKCLSKIYSKNRIFAKNDFRGYNPQTPNFRGC